MTKILNSLKKRFPTLFLRLVIIFLTTAVLAFCAFLLPSFGSEAVGDYPATNIGMWIIVFKIALYLTLIPFFVAINSTFTLLKNIDMNTALTESSIKALRRIKYCAVCISILYVGLIPLIASVGEIDDAPGLMVIGLIIPFIPLIIAVFADILQKLLQNTLDIKIENDLTV